MPVISTCYLWPHNETVSKIQQKQLSKTNRPTDRPKTHQWDTRKNKQKSMNVGKGLVQQRWWWQGREGRVNGALQTCMKFHEIPKNKANQKAHQTSKPINRNSNNYNNLSSSYLWAKSFISILWHNPRIEFFLPFISKETQTWKLYINCLWLHF